MILTLALALASAQATPAPAPATAEEIAIMDRIEHDVRLPRGAAPLARYRRSYTWLGDRSVVAIYEQLTDGAPGRSWVAGRELPHIDDGGCAVVTVFYNPRTHAIDTMCNADPFASMHR